MAASAGSSLQNYNNELVRAAVVAPRAPPPR